VLISFRVISYFFFIFSICEINLGATLGSPDDRGLPAAPQGLTHFSDKLREQNPGYWHLTPQDI
jgi:hypothetical protein